MCVCVCVCVSRALYGSVQVNYYDILNKIKEKIRHLMAHVSVTIILINTR